MEELPVRDPGATARLDALDAMLARAGAGESFAAIRRSLVPPEWAPVLTRGAVAGRFDQVIYDRLLAPADSSDTPTLDALADSGIVDAVPGQPGWFTMPPQDRAVWSAELPEPDLIALESGLAEEHFNRGDEVEGLRHLLAADPDEGRIRLEALFNQADEQFDLARCQDILAAADADERSSGAELAGLVADLKAYLTARSMWLPDYLQSAHFLAPPGLQQRAAELLANQHSRVWELIGPGGMGKTMQLRWLVSRRWVPRPAHTPCVRIDFDAADPVACARYPFLTLVLVADQLGRQLPRNPFSQLLRSYEPFLALARRGAGNGAPIDPGEARLAAQQVPEHFAAGCRAAGEGPIVVILDTLEELSLRYPAETAAIVDQFGDMLDAVPALRLVFSGRYAVPAVRERFPDLTRIPVQAFDAEQANAYLQQIRGITDPHRRTDIVARTAGLPFVLAMYGDLVTGDPDVVLDDVDLKLEPRLVYLVERVIVRIREPLVRWLLRYGSVPRRLTRRYVLDVLAPFVVQAASGDPTLDDPMLDPITQWRGRPLFPTDLPELRVLLEDAWADLQRYVSSSSWVSQAPGEPDTLLLKTEVLGPLRAVLAGRPVLRQLHERSAQYYAELAGQQTVWQARFLGERIYHLAQSGTDGLVEIWQSLVDGAREAGAYPALADLCAEVVGPEYVGDDGLPLGHSDGRPIVPRALVVEAHLWRAYAAQAIALRGGQGGPQWTAIGREREMAGRVAGTDLPTWVRGRPAERRSLLAAAITVVAAARALAGGQPETTWTLTQGWEEVDGDLALSQAALQVAAAQRLDQDDVSVLARFTDRALRSYRDGDAVDACIALTDRLLAAGDVGSAVEWVERADAATGLLADRYLWLLIEQGTPAAAVSWVASRQRAADEGLAELRARAEAWLVLREPPRALSLLDRSDDLVTVLADPAVRLRESAECLQLKGVTFGAMLRLDEASSAFEQAASLWREVGHPHGHLRSRRQHAEMLLHECGDVAEAALLLDGLAPQLDDGAESAAVRLLTAEVRARSGDVEAAARIVEQVMSVTPVRSLARRRVQAAVAGIVATQDVERFGPALLESLSLVRPTEAKLRLLEGLRWSPPLPEHPVLQSLVDHVMIRGTVLDQDETVHHLQRAYVARAGGRTDEMRLRLESAVRYGSPFLAWEVIRHFGPDVPDHAYRVTAPLASGDPPQYGAMAGVLHLRQAEQQRQGGDPAEADQLAEQAVRELSGNSRRSGWPAEALALRGAIAATDRARAEEALTYLRAAQLRYQRLGDVVAGDVVAAAVVAASAPAGGDRAIPTRGLPTIPPASAAPSQDGVRSARRWPPPSLPQRRGAIGGSVYGQPPRSGELVVTPESLRSLVWRTMPPGPQRRLAEVAAMRSALGAEPGSDDPAGPPETPVRVEATEPDVLALPWELVAERVYRSQPPAGSTRRDQVWLRWVLESGRLPLPGDVADDCRDMLRRGAPLTQDLRERVERAISGSVEDRRVAIIKGSRTAERSWGYSHADRGLELADSYRRAGWDAVELTPAEAHRPGLLVKLRPTVIHIAGRMEVSGTLGWFDASLEDNRTRAVRKGAGQDTGMFVTGVIQWLAALDDHPRSGPPPVVVLDPVAAPNLPARDLLLAARNRFAAGLYLDGYVMAVLATGLVERDPFAAQQAWLTGLRQGHPLERIARDVRAHTDPGAPAALFAPSATFTLPTGTPPAG